MTEVNRATSCANDINACHREDQYAREMLDHVVSKQGNEPASSKLTPYGDGYRAAKAEGTATRAGARVGKKAAVELAHMAEEEAPIHAGTHLADHAIKKASGSKAALAAQGAKLAGKGLTVFKAAHLGFTILEVATKAHMGAVAEAKAQGRREMDGLNRDAMNAFVVAGAGVFSDEYRTHVLGAMSEDSRKVALKLADEALIDSKRFGAERMVMRAQAEQGIGRAKELELKSSRDLADALQKDEALRERYTSSTAFRHGVDSVVFEATRKAKQ